MNHFHGTPHTQTIVFIIRLLSIVCHARKSLHLCVLRVNPVALCFKLIQYTQYFTFYLAMHNLDAGHENPSHALQKIKGLLYTMVSLKGFGKTEHGLERGNSNYKVCIPEGDQRTRHCCDMERFLIDKLTKP